jgi:hypothetical protein
MKKMMVALLTGAMLMMVTSAMATPFTGSIWSSNVSAQNPALGPPAGPSLGTFTVDKINFNTLTYGSTYDTWLQGSSTNANGLAWLTTPVPGFITSNTTGTFIQFTGSGYFSANTVITHDDGFYLALTDASSVTKTYDFSTPVYTQTDTLTNAVGVYVFTLNYGAWNGFPETLIVDIASVPEPATMLLLGLGLIGLAGVRRKFKK